MQVLHRFPDDGSLEYRQATYAMVLTNALASARLRGDHYTREEIHKSTIDNLPLAKQFIDRPLTKAVLDHIDAESARISEKIKLSKLLK